AFDQPALLAPEARPQRRLLERQARGCGFCLGGGFCLALGCRLRGHDAINGKRAGKVNAGTAAAVKDGDYQPARATSFYGFGITRIFVSRIVSGSMESGRPRKCPTPHTFSSIKLPSTFRYEPCCATTSTIHTVATIRRTRAVN